MADLSQLSDEGLLKLLNATLKPSGDENLPQTLSIAGMDTGIGLPPSIAASIVGAGKATTRLGQGVQQAWYGMTGNAPAQEALKQKVASENAMYAPLQQSHPIATALGEAAPTLAIPLGAGASVAGALGRAGLAGALPGAVEYGTAEEKAKNAAMGAAGGAVGGLGGLGLGRLINPVRGSSAEAVQGTKDLAGKFGLDLTPAQITGSPVLGYMESAAANLPGGAARMSAVKAGQSSGMNRALMSTMGSTADKVTPEAVAAGQGELGATMRAVSKGPTITVDDQLLNELGAIESHYSKRLDTLQKPIVQNFIDDIVNSGGKIPGETYQNTRVELGQMAASTGNSGLGLALKGIQKSLDRAFDRTAEPEAVAALKAARAQYAASKTVEKMTTPLGDVSPARVAQAAKGGPGDLSDLARLAATIKPLPDSGTAQRSFWMNLLQKPLHESLTPANLLAISGMPWATANVMTRNLPGSLPGGKAYLTNTAISPEIERLLARYGAYPGAAGGLLGPGQ